MNQYAVGLAYQSTSSACVVDLTPPTYSGITSLSALSSGALQANWSAGTDLSSPIRYEVYIQAGSSSGLFNLANVSLATFLLSSKIYSLADGSLLQAGIVYFVGVRAVDAVNNRDANSVSQSATSLGVPDNSLFSLVNAIKTKSDQLVFTSGRVDSVISGTQEDAIVDKVWDELLSSHSTTGTSGKKLTDIPISPVLSSDTRLNNLDAAISTRESEAAAAARAVTNISEHDTTQAALTLVPTNPLLTSDVRLNNLDATISSRQTETVAASRHAANIAEHDTTQAALALVPINPLLTSDTRLNNLDASVSSRQAESVAASRHSINIAEHDTTQAALALVPANPLLTSDVRLNNLDATVSSRQSESIAASRHATNIGEHDATQAVIASLPTASGPTALVVAAAVWNTSIVAYPPNTAGSESHSAFEAVLKTIQGIEISGDVSDQSEISGHLEGIELTGTISEEE